MGWGAVLDYGHHLMVLPLVAAGVCSLGMFVDPFVRISRVAQLFFICLAGISIWAIGLWQWSKPSYHHAGTMMLHIVICQGALATAGIFMLRLQCYSRAYQKT